MSKVLILGDTHVGARNDNPIFADYFEAFYRDVLFPYIDAHQIEYIVQTGDVFDRRKYINFVSLKSSEEFLFKQIETRPLCAYFLVGNHDTYFKNTIKVNSVDLIASRYSNIHAVQSPVEVEIDGTKILCVPWICSENRAEILKAIEETKAKILIGHFEIQGFEMYSGFFADEGESPDLFKKFDLVLSGHFHHKSTSGNISYVGTPYELIWSDFEDPKGFHVLDTSTLELEFIENPYRMFYKLFYDDQTIPTIEELAHLKEKFVKVIIKAKDNPLLFDQFIERLEKVGVADILVVEDHLYLNLEEDSDIVADAEDTLSILQQSAQNIEGVADETKQKIVSTLHRLYHEALAGEID